MYHQTIPGAFAVGAKALDGAAVAAMPRLQGPGAPASYPASLSGSLPDELPDDDPELEPDDDPEDDPDDEPDPDDDPEDDPDDEPDDPDDEALPDDPPEDEPLPEEDPSCVPPATPLAPQAAKTRALRVIGKSLLMAMCILLGLRCDPGLNLGEPHKALELVIVSCHVAS